MKKIVLLFSTLLLIMCLNPIQIFANEDLYSFVLTTDGKNEKDVETGDIITVTLNLKCSNSDSCRITAFQDEIKYDSEFFELVPNSMLIMSGVKTNDIALQDRYRAFYMNYVALDGPIEVQNSTIIGSFQLKTIATTGVSKLKNSNCIVTDENGEETTLSQEENHDITVKRSNEIEVHVKDDGGTLIQDELVEYQKPMKKPQAMNSDGLYAQDFNKDINGEEQWNFKDNVNENMTIFGDNWSEKVPTNSSYVSIVIVFIAVLLISLFFIILLEKRKSKNLKQ